MASRRHNALLRGTLAVTLGLLLAFAAQIASMGTSGGSASAQPSPDTYKPGEVLVRFRPGASVAQARLETLGVGRVDALPVLRAHRLRVPPGKEQEVVERLRRRADVELAEVVALYHTLDTPNDALYGDQWNLAKVNLPSARDVTTGSNAIRVAVIDTGFAVGHPDGPVNLVLGPDYGNDRPVTDRDLHGHGTHVAGIIAAQTNNEIGVAAVAPSVTLMVVKVFPDPSANDPNPGASIDAVASGIVWAVNNGAQVINLSLGGPYSGILQSEIDYAVSKGVLVVAAAGNAYQFGNPPYYPAAYPNVLAVAATDRNDQHASYSNTGSYVDIAAPGGDDNGPIVSLGRSQTYAAMYGTSMAAPHVAGLAGLLWSINPCLSATQLSDTIKATAVRLGGAVPNDTFGYGRIDVNAAVRAVSGPLVTPTPNPLLTNRVFLPLVMRPCNA